MRIKNSKITTLFLLTAFGFLTMMSTGCKPDSPEPELPPEASFIMNFDDFQETNKTVDSTTAWGYSAVNVAVWDVILFVNLAVPVAAFYESFNHDAKWNRKQERYIWSYTINVGFNKYDVELHGWIVGQNINWELHVSQQNGFQDFVWYTGVSQLDRLGGAWTLYRTPDAPESYLTIDWTNDYAGNAYIKYTNIIPGVPDNGSYIEYGTDTDPDFDRYYNIFIQSSTKTTEIEWDYDSKAGRVRDEVHFGDTDWHCWDYTFTDTGC